MKTSSIKRTSQYGFLALIAGFLISGGLLLYFLFLLDGIKEEQQVTEDAYNTLFELKYLTERLLTTYDLTAERKLWEHSRSDFESALKTLKAVRGEQTETVNNLWAVIRKEIASIDRQLDHPLFQAKNTMDKSLLRRLGEGLNSNTTSEYYLRMSRLFNAIEYLKQYESFLLDELSELRKHHRSEVEQRLFQTKLYAVTVPSAVLMMMVLFALMISRLIGRNELALMRTQNDLQVSLDEFEHLFDTTMESIFLLENGQCVDANEKAMQMFGFAAKEAIVGKRIMELIAPGSRQYVAEMLELDESAPYEAQALRGDGTPFPVLCRGHNFLTRGRKIRIAAMLELTDLKEKDRELQRTVLQLRENEERLMEQQRVLDHMAHHDILTRLPNRAFFLERFSEAIERSERDGTKTAVCFIDLDRFKEINDSLGHTMGDEVLQIVSERLQATVRGRAVISRIGGDEFTLLVEKGVSPQTLSELAAEIIEVLQKPMHAGEYELYITSSIGISIYPDDGSTEVLLLSNADAAMYRAKAEGRNTFKFFTKEMTASAYERLLMERNLRHALEGNAFALYYQPQFDALDGSVVGAEALIRWPQEGGGMIPPGTFIPIAEESGLIVPIGAWVLREACRQMAEWKSAGRAIGRIAVNLSGKQLRHEGLFETVIQILEETGCRPEWLELEVTEGFIMENPEHSVGLLKAFGELGIEIAIDDFGTGHSSLTYLKQLPIDTLKIDQSFVRELPRNRDDAAIIRTIIALGRGLDLKLIAEGVETEEQKIFLSKEGCRYHQGYFYSRPLPAEAVEALL